MNVQALSLSVRACSSPQLPMTSASIPEYDTRHLLRAAELAGSSAGLSAPHPNSGCVIVHRGNVVGEGFLYAQGTKSAEVQAVERAGESARMATAYLNLEPGDCHGDDSAVRALIQVDVCVCVCVCLGHFLIRSWNYLNFCAINAGFRIWVKSVPMLNRLAGLRVPQCCISADNNNHMTGRSVKGGSRDATSIAAFARQSHRRPPTSRCQGGSG